ncbi:SPW repeat domain-containing protein [Streptomyces sp. NPDC002787]
MATAHHPDQVRSERDPEQILIRGQRQQIIGLLLIISVFVLFVAPWIAGYPETAKDAHRNELGAGLVVLFLAMARFVWYPGKWSDLAVPAAGAWMMASPWALSRQNTVVFDGTQVIDVVVGIVLVVLAGLSSLLLVRSERHSARQKAQRVSGAGHERGPNAGGLT